MTDSPEEVAAEARAGCFRIVAGILGALGLFMLWAMFFGSGSEDFQSKSLFEKAKLVLVAILISGVFLGYAILGKAGRFNEKVTMESLLNDGRSEADSTDTEKKATEPDSVNIGESNQPEKSAAREIEFVARLLAIWVYSALAGFLLFIFLLLPTMANGGYINGNSGPKWIIAGGLIWWMSQYLPPVVYWFWRWAGTGDSSWPKIKKPLILRFFERD